ncbi:M-phase-specific PLK1-interacting protein [Bagarius yarrelli]|uniref:M-phase-specific PLK1-interacting protein n=1 Tax=Bagarius yarrelli TaxID=175774 RepID=A0A556VWC3_BAGYA|nr:M-phase-specific PLK1-interacting protein [Bagarius yarrelli]
MQRPQFRPPHPAGGGFRTPPTALDRTGGGRFPSPPYGFPNGPYGPRFGSHGGSPVTHTSPSEFGGNRSGGSGMYNIKSPGHTPRRPSGSPAFRPSPYQSPGAHGGYPSPGAHSGYQGSPRTSTPYRRDRSTNDMDKYYKASMLQDPWANLQPVSVTQTPSKYSIQQVTHTGRTGRYYNKNYTA